MKPPRRHPAPATDSITWTVRAAPTPQLPSSTPNSQGEREVPSAQNVVGVGNWRLELADFGLFEQSLDGGGDAIGHDRVAAIVRVDLVSHQLAVPEDAAEDVRNERG